LSEKDLTERLHHPGPAKQSKSSDKDLPEQLGHSGPPKHTEPVEGHGGTSYENVDARPGLIIWSLAVIVGTVVIVFAMTLGFHKMLEDGHSIGELPSPLAPGRVLAPAPQLQVHPWEEMPDMRAHENDVLNSSGKDANGRIHVPIDKAMDTVVSRLQVEPNAPRGIYTPGGEGRAFSGGLSNMPPAYHQAPQIQGEIRKRAQ
jgi:hypothetical protein